MGRAGRDFDDAASGGDARSGPGGRRARAEEAARLERSRLAEAQRIAKIGSWELDFRADALRWSDEVFRIFEVDPAFVEPSYDRFLSLIHPDDRAAVDAAFGRSLESREPYRITHRLVMSDDRIKWVEEQCETTFDAEGAPVISRGTVQDVTETRLAQEGLRRSERTLSSILGTSPEAIIIADEAGRVRIFSDGAEKMFRRTRGEMIGEPLNALVAPESHADCRTLLDPDAALASGRREILARRATGDAFPAEISVSRIESEDGLVFTAIVRDLSERKAYEAALQGAKARAESASEAKSAFLATMSHEIRTPMNAVLGMLSVLARSPLDDKQTRMVDSAIEAGKSLMAILNDVLDYSRMEAGAFGVEIAEFDCRAVLARIETLHRFRAEARGLAFELRVDPALPESLHGDPARLQQILHNLVDNAVKFTSEGRIVVRAIHRNEDDGASALELVVADTGIGISHDQREHIFQAFTQADSSTTRRFEGSGLGLSIVRRLVDAMSGEIMLDSRPGEGATFTVRLPMAAGAQPRQAISASARECAPRVLIARPDDARAELLRRLRDELGFAPTLASTAHDAVAAFEPGRFALVVMDADLPALGGEAAAKSMRAAERAVDAAPTRLVACLAEADKQRADRCRQAGFDVVVTHPLDDAALDCVLPPPGVRRPA